MGRTKRMRKRGRSNERGVRDASAACVLTCRWAVARGVSRNGLEVAVFPETGRGMRCKRDIQIGTCLVSVPECLLVTPDKVKASAIGRLLKGAKMGLKPVQLLCIFLIYEQSLGPDSDWHSYILSLPHSFVTPPFLTDEEMSLIPLHLQDKAGGIRATVTELFDNLKKKIAHCLQLTELVTISQFRWAWSVVNTRSVYMDDENKYGMVPGSCMALAPYLDFLNHSAAVEVDAKFNKVTRCYEVYTKTPYKKGQQVFISYGSHGNDTLFLEYGFVLKHNPHSAVQMDDVLKLLASDNVEKKSSILKSCDLLRNLLCTADGLSWRLMTALRIWNMNHNELSQWQTVLKGEPVSDENEVLCTKQLRQFCQYWLSQIEASIVKLSAHTPSAVKSSCLTLQLEYRLIIQTTLRQLTNTSS